MIETRYDFIIDDGHKLERVQVKYASGKPQRSQGSLLVNLKSWKGRKMSRRYRSDEVDALLVYIPQIDKILRFETNVFCGRGNFSVRIKPSKNGQSKGIRYAEDYVW